MLLADCPDEGDDIDELLDEKIEKYKGISVKHFNSNPLLKQKGALDKVQLVKIFSFDDFQPVARNFLSKQQVASGAQSSNDLNLDKQEEERLHSES